MAIELNSSALNAFRELHLENANAIVNVDGEGLTQNGTYTGALSSLSRSKETKAENNAARTALLKSLGRAFNVKGMTEVDGKVTFSKEFMTRLEKILGADFKRGDFGINANGEVASGKPLTMRRVQAIVKKADFVGTGTFSVDAYRRKFEVMLKDLGAAKMSPEEMRVRSGIFLTLHNIANMLTFLEKEVHESICVNLAYEVHCEYVANGGVDADDEPFKGARFQYLDMTKGEQGEYVDCEKIDDWIIYVCKRTGLVFHPERCSGYSKEDYKTYPKANQYLADNLKLYVKKVVDNFFAAKECGKMDAFSKKVLGAEQGVCLEEKCLRLLEFEKEHLTQNEAMNAVEVDALNRIVDAAPVNGELPSVEKLIYKEIEVALGLGEQYANSEDWNDFAALVKERLVGTTAKVMQAVLEGDEYKFEPVMVDGKPVVRPLTAEDIDAIGPACLAKIMGY